MGAVIEMYVAEGFFGGKLAGVLIVKRYIDPELPARMFAPESLHLVKVSPKIFDEDSQRIR